MNRYGVPPVFRPARRTEFNQREWFKRSVLAHRHDKAGAFLKPTRRWLPGLEQEKVDWQERIATWVACIGIAVLIGWRWIF